MKTCIQNVTKKLFSRRRSELRILLNNKMHLHHDIKKTQSVKFGEIYSL